MSFASRALIALALGFAPMGAARAQDGLRLTEQTIKAGLIYNFMRYTQWPAQVSETAPLVVCIYGEDAIEDRLAPLRARSIEGRGISLERPREIAQTQGCSLLFVAATERAHWRELREALARRPVLTVADFEGFAAAGGMIEFIRADDRIGVRVNREALSRAGLVVGERLLRLAEAAPGDRPQ